ncbi:MAG: molecular chaperone [Candidatus Methylomirabilales bacterium]
MRLRDLARFRHAAYRLFGAVFLYPTEERFTTLIAAARELERHSEPFVGLAFFPQWRTFLGTLARRRDSGTADLEAAYLDLFVVNQKVPLYESGFLAPGTPALTMAALEGDYNAAGLSVAASFTEPPDHAAVELEFMSFLCGKEAEAWTKRSLKDGVHRLEAEAKFLDRHLSCWFPAFADQVALRAGDGFYTSVTRAAHAFIGHDQALLVPLLAQYRQEATHG